MSKIVTAAFAAVLTAVLTTVPAAQAAGQHTIVATDKGLVQGTATSTHRTFGTIPYAAPPVGANRWRDPQPVQPWTGVRDATTPSPVCAQPGSFGQPGSEVEDCLYLNVTTPAKPQARPRPVMVWIHGGSFTTGSAGLYTPRSIVERTGAVVVTINYRLGVFGYYGLPGLPGSGAFGLADQQAALKWVQRNIRAFGGDAGNVTLFGESAGGLSVCAQMTSPAAAGLFHKAIIQSGPCGLTVPAQGRYDTLWRSRQQVEDEGAKAQAQLGCTDLACLRQLPPSTLLAVHNTFGFPAFHTTVMPTDPVVAQRTGRMHRMPTLVGSTHDEATLFLGLTTPPVADESYQQAVTGTFGAEHAAQVMARYPLNGNGDARDELAAALTDASWACPSHDTRTQLGGRMPVHGYDFTDPTPPLLFPGLPPFPGGYRAYHASELSFLFDIPGTQLTAAQQQLKEYMIDAWGRFARTGQPGWRTDVQSLAAGAIGSTDFAADHRCGFWSSIL